MYDNGRLSERTTKPSVYMNLFVSNEQLIFAIRSNRSG